MNTAVQLSQLRQTAARVLAKAVLDLHPSAYPIQGGETSSAFFFDFVFSDPFSKDAFPFLEEKMRSICAQNVDIQIHEMVPSNAASWMRYQGFVYPADLIQRSKGCLAEVVQIGDFLDCASGPFLNTTGDLKAFKLLTLEKRTPLNIRGNLKTVYRILGVADVGRGELKEFLRENREWVGVDHLSVGEELGLFQTVIRRDHNHEEVAKVFWKKEGEALLHGFYSFWRTIHLAAGFELVVTRASALIDAHEKLLAFSKKRDKKEGVRFAEFVFPPLDQEFSLKEGLLGARQSHYDQSHVFCLKEHLSFCLKRALKWLDQMVTHVQSKTCIEIVSPKQLDDLFFKGTMSPMKHIRLEWRFRDSFGKEWDGPFLEVKKKDAIFMIKQSLFNCVERIIALILEKREKDLSQKKELLSKLTLCNDLG